VPGAPAAHIECRITHDQAAAAGRLHVGPIQSPGCRRRDRRLDRGAPNETRRGCSRAVSFGFALGTLAAKIVKPQQDASYHAVRVYGSVGRCIPGADPPCRLPPTGLVDRRSMREPKSAVSSGGGDCFPSRPQAEYPHLRNGLKNVVRSPGGQTRRFHAVNTVRRQELFQILVVEEREFCRCGSGSSGSEPDGGRITGAGDDDVLP
jgi:hypothetical protein